MRTFVQDPSARGGSGHVRVPRPQDSTRGRTPQVWSIDTLKQSITAGSSLTKTYRWQRELVLVFMQVLCTPFSAANMALIELAWEDHHGDQVFTTGLQSLTGTPLMLAQGDIGPGGYESQWAPTDFRVSHADVWTFTITNNTAVTIVPTLLFSGVERG